MPKNRKGSSLCGGFFSVRLSDLGCAVSAAAVQDGEGREIFVTSVQRRMREAAMDASLKAYAALPFSWRQMIAAEAGLDILKLSRASQDQRREIQRAARRIAGRDGMGYFMKAVLIVAKTCTE